ncbi:WD40 repeat domain-containing protein [Thalassotalea sp. PP2-459]|uniref:WD40 repeat domain-containing protein n=1 Tax=Thalassotalea sp. PP2-459 TaxID=1742724 RepID=UPI0009455481|nr:WD40 repeat domain-containing protein [Thalassotalea sp. PP2-459]OKY27381.1 hypothetical protein BI291_00720 [Thalassotalea sp. PP2-459]
MKKYNIAIVLSLVIAILPPFVDASTRPTNQNVLNQTDESGKIAITGKPCKRHASSCNGVTVKNLETGAIIFQENKVSYKLDYNQNPYSPIGGRYYNFTMAPNGERFGFWFERWNSSEDYFYIYQTNPVKLIQKIKGGDWDDRAEFSASGKRLVLENHNRLAVFDVDSGKRLPLENAKFDNSREVLSIAITPDDTKLISTVEYGIVAWDLATGKHLYNHNTRKRSGFVVSGTNYGSGQLRFSKDNKTALSVSGSIFVLDVNTGQLIKRFKTKKLSPNDTHYAKVDFIDQGNLPLVTVFSPLEFLKSDKYEVFIADWQQEKRLMKIGETGDNYHQLRKHALELTSSKYTEQLLEETEKAKHLTGIAQLTKLAALYQQNDVPLSRYFPERRQWIEQLKTDWYTLAKQHINQAKNNGNVQLLQTLINSDLLGNKENRVLAYQSLHSVLKNNDDYKRLIALAESDYIPAQIKRDSLLDAIERYPDTTKLTDYLALADKFNDDTSVTNAVFNKVYQRVKEADNIASYQWYIKHVPQSEHTQEALLTLYKRAFELADDRGTIASYNDFIIAYPFAPQVNQATDNARELEEDEYSSYFSSDEELSRRLLVRSKQISRIANQYRYDNTGYLLVIDRMNTLLQDMYPGQDATLRHLESEEFKDFHRDFSRAMRSLSTKLDNINDNVKDLKRHVAKQSDMIEQHFEKAAQDRETASELTRQHRMWERYLQGKS